MRKITILIPETHLECEFCKTLGICYYCTAIDGTNRYIHEPKEKIDFALCPIWGKILEKYRPN